GDLVMSDAPVRPGDTITVGLSTLLVSGNVHSGGRRSDSTPDLNTRAFNAGESIYFGGPDAEKSLSRRVESLQDLVELFNLALVFNEVSGPHEIAACIRKALNSRFRPKAAWSARL